MKRVIVTSLILSLLLLPTSVAAQSTGANLTFQKITFANANFQEFDSTGCILTAGFVYALDGNIFDNNIGHDKMEDIAVVVAKYNLCTGYPLLNAITCDLTQPMQFYVNPSLNSAFLTVGLTMCDMVSLDAFDVTVNITWTGTGKVTHDNYTRQDEGPGFRAIEHVTGWLTDATATGTIVDMRTNENFARLPSFFAQMTRLASGNLTIEMQH